jgi:OOP family OmpA-OmpF porin
VEGDTDAAGSKEYNYELSERRATKISSYLASKYNVPAFRIYSIGFGADKPVADNKSIEGRAQNRRVTIVLMSSGVQTQVSQSPMQSSALK